MSGTVFSALQILTHLILTNIKSRNRRTNLSNKPFVVTPKDLPVWQPLKCIFPF